MKIKTFSEFISEVENFRKAADGSELWYRGHGLPSYVLQPGLHRLAVPIASTDIARLEAQTYDEFHRRSPLYDRTGRDRWDLLFLMQHYRTPTRLLDWTSSPLVALYFALMTDRRNEDAVLWCLDPAGWNSKMLGDIHEDPKIFTTEDSMIEQYHPKYNGKASRSEPLAIQGIVNNPRINAQKGRFVIFGNENKSMENYSSQFKISKGGSIMKKLTLYSKSRSVILSDLEAYGITYSTIFPDLEGLAAEISRKLRG